MIIHKFPSGVLLTNAILFGCSSTKKCAVIDPSQGSTESILQTIQKEKLLLEKIILTHSHWDHIVDVHELKSRTGVPLYVHPLDVDNLIKPGSDGIPLYFPIHGEKPDGFFEDGQIIQLGTLQVEVIHTPGHSPGGVCFYLREEKILFSGDTLFQGSMGNVHLPTSNPSDMWESLQKLALLPKDTRVIPGHGNDTTIDQESWMTQAKELFL